jgi:hypothetical protein
VLGRSFWKKRFNADPAGLPQGRRQWASVCRCRRRSRSFYGTYALIEFDACMPFGMIYPEKAYTELVTRRDNHDLRVLGRLQKGSHSPSAGAA